MNIGIYIYNNTEVLDFTGPCAIFTTASRMYARQQPSADPFFNVFLIAEKDGFVTTCADFKINPLQHAKSSPMVQKHHLRSDSLFTQ